MAKSRSLNKVILIGNLTRNPIIKETSGNVVVCTFGIATNTSWKDKDGEFKEKAEFHNLIAFNKLAEICAQVLSTGMLVYVEGELRSRITEDDGKKHYRTEIKLNDMILIDAKGRKGVGFENARDINSDQADSLGSETHDQEDKHEEDSLKSEDLF
jgi:single-strand DNA-binding protein